MKNLLSLALSLLLFGVVSAADPAPLREVQARLGEYIDAFNCGDAPRVAAFWAPNAVSLDEETGERTIGRDAIQAEFQAFFAESSGARLSGQVTHVRLVRPDVAIAEGAATLFVPGEDPTLSAFTAVLIKEEGKWLLESSQERDLPLPESPADALEELAFLVGEWRDQTEGVQVTTAVRWSPNKAFLIRSYRADYEDGESFEGTQIIGWDPRTKEFRTWSFNSDGSFGQGTASRSSDSWLLKMSQVECDGSLATATQVITVVDEDTLTVQRIGQTVDGAPVPASDPVTVVRVVASETPAEAKP